MSLVVLMTALLLVIALRASAETGSGKIKWEEVGGVLYVTYEGVEFSGSFG